MATSEVGEPRHGRKFTKLHRRRFTKLGDHDVVTFAWLCAAVALTAAERQGAAVLRTAAVIIAVVCVSHGLDRRNPYASNGTIGYTTDASTLATGLPVAKVLNAAGYYTGRRRSRSCGR